MAEDVGRQRRSAWRRYAELLGAAALASPEAAAGDSKTLAALRDAAGALGKSPADVEADGRALAKAARLRARIEARPGMDAAQRCDSRGRFSRARLGSPRVARPAGALDAPRPLRGRRQRLAHPCTPPGATNRRRSIAP
jgi:hypothetical protein